MNNPLEQLDALYSSWSVADKATREMQLIANIQVVRAAYLYLVQLYNARGYLNSDEAKTYSQLQRMLQWIQIQKVQVERELADEMMKHLAKMMIKR